jgi:hypothetical protein
MSPLIAGIFGLGAPELILLAIIAAALGIPLLIALAVVLVVRFAAGSKKRDEPGNE